MQGTIAFDGTLTGSIAGGGGGGGSEVSITPVLTEGEEIADFEIDGTPGKLYAPEALITSVQIPLLIVGKQLRIDLSSYYTKAEIAIELQTYQRQMESIDSQVDISGTHNNQISLTFDIDDYQKKLTAGPNITIDPVSNEISASGGSSWNYSTSEVNTGQKWTDGKDIYCKVFDLTIPNQSGAVTFNVPTPDLNEVIDVRYSVNGKGPVYETPWYSQAAVYFDSMDANGVYFYFDSTYNQGRPLRVISFYTKS